MVVDAVVGTLGVLGVLVGALSVAYQWFWMPRLRRRVIVTFRDPAAPSLEGILARRWGPWLTLRDVSAIDGMKRTPTKLDGEVTIDRAVVLFLQVSDERRR